MKKIFKLFMTIMILFVFIPFVKAKTLTEETNEYIGKIDNFALESKNKIQNLSDWLNTYKTEFSNVLDYNLINNINEKIQSDSYDETIHLLVTALNNKNYVAAANSLNIIGADEFLNDYVDFKLDLLNFISDNADEMSITAEDPECLECLLDMYEAFNNAYDTIKPAYTNLLNTISNVFSTVVDLKLTYYQTLTNNELMSLVETYDDLGTIVSELITKFYDSLDDYQEVFAELIGNDELLLNKLKTKFRSDFKTLLDTCEANLQEPLNSFVADRWDILRDDVNDTLNASTNVLSKNAYIYDKMKQINNVNKKFDKKLQDIMNKIDSNIVNDFINNILKRADKELQDAVSYLEGKIIIEEYDVKLVEEPTEDIFINRATEMLVLDKILTATQFQSNILLANQNSGTLGFDFLNSQVVGTKSRVNVLENNIIMKNYVVVVKGDIDANARITITDAIEAAYYSLNARTFDKYELIAADLDENDNITITDAWEIARKALEQGR